MILREHLLTVDSLTGNPKTVRTGYYDHVMHEIPGMLERWNTPIGCDDVVFVQYDAGAYVSAISSDGYSVRMLTDVKIAVASCYLSIDT